MKIIHRVSTLLVLAMFFLRRHLCVIKRSNYSKTRKKIENAFLQKNVGNAEKNISTLTLRVVDDLNLSLGFLEAHVNPRTSLPKL